MKIDPNGVLMAQAKAAKRGALVIWTIYDKPADHPDGFIARMHEIGGGEESPRATANAITGELEDLRRCFWQAGMLKLTRDARDEPQIVETWV